MADRFLIPAGGAYLNAATDIWGPSSGSAPDLGGLNATADIAILDNLSGNLTLDGELTAIGLDMELYSADKTVDLDTSDMVINGTLEALGGRGTVEGTGTIIVSGTSDHRIHADATIAATVILKFTAASGIPTLTHTGAAFPTIGGLEIDNNPTSFILGADLPVAGDLIFTAGKFDTQTNSVSVTMSGTNNIQWDTITTEHLYHLILASGAAITRVGVTECVSVTIPSDATLDGNAILQVRPTGDDSISIAGTIGGTGTVNLLLRVSQANSNPINVGTKLVIEGEAAGRVITQSGQLTVNELVVRGLGTDENAKLVLEGSGHALGAVTVGSPIATKEGFIDLGNGSGTITSLIAGGGVGDENGFDFGQSSWQATGTLDFTDIAVVVDVAAHLQGGDVRNLDSLGITGGVLHCHNTNDGGGSTAAIAAGEVTFDQHAPPGSLATMRVGI